MFADGFLRELAKIAFMGRNDGMDEVDAEVITPASGRSTVRDVQGQDLKGGYLDVPGIPAPKKEREPVSPHEPETRY